MLVYTLVFEKAIAGALGFVERAKSPQQGGRRIGEDIRQEHRAPATAFSVVAFSQLHLRADCLPQEHLASAAQAQDPLERPQQVLGTVMVI